MRDSAEKKQRNWEDAFQRWCDKHGKCGKSRICEYCTGNWYGRPCVRALNELNRRMGTETDYDVRNYEEIWNG